MAVRIPSAVAKATPSLSGPKALKSVSFVAGAMMLGECGLFATCLRLSVPKYGMIRHDTLQLVRANGKIGFRTASRD